MASTTSFAKTVFESGVSFLRVSIGIFLLCGLIASIALALIDDGKSEIGILLLLVMSLILWSGIIGLTQKLISDAFLDGFMAAKNEPSIGNGVRMNTEQTLISGFQVIWVIAIALGVSLTLAFLGAELHLQPDEIWEKCSEDNLVWSSDGEITCTGWGITAQETIGDLFYAAGCTVLLCVMLGLVARILAEGVAFGASSTGVSFDSGSFESHEPSTDSDTPIKDWFNRLTGQSKRLILFSTASLYGLFLPWEVLGERHNEGHASFSGFDMLGSPTESPLVCPTGYAQCYEKEYYTLSENFNWLIIADGGGGIVAIQGMLIWLLPWFFVTTFAFAWFGYSKGDEKIIIRAGRWHATIFIIFLISLIVSSFTADPRSAYGDPISNLDYIIIDRLGIWVAGLASLGLLPDVMKRLSSALSKGGSQNSDANPTFKGLDSDGDGVLSKEELEASDEVPDGTFEKMDADGDGSISEEEFDEFNFDFDDEE